MNEREFLVSQGFKLDLCNDNMYGAKKKINDIEIDVNFYLGTMFVHHNNTRYSESFKDYTFWQEYKHMIEYVNKLLLVSNK